MLIISERTETDELYALRAETWSHLNEITEPTMDRTALFPKNDFNNHFLHKYTQGEFGAPALHDHPWWSISFLLYGKLEEVTYDVPQSELEDFRYGYQPIEKKVIRPNWPIKREPIPRVLVRPPGLVHTVQLKSEKAATYFVTGPRVRNWGFYTKWGWIPYHRMAEFAVRMKNVEGEP